MNVSCGVYCVFIVNGVLGIDACWVYSVCSVYEAFGLIVFVAFMGHWSWTLVAFLQCWQCLWGIGVGRLWRFTTFVAFMGRWCCTFGTCVVCSLCMFLPPQHRWVPLGLAYWGSGFSQPWAPSLRAWFSARRSLRLGVGAHGWRARVCRPWGRNSF